jgi:hypothetical protein
MTTVLYRVRVPFSLADDEIEVYGDAEMGWYEWRVVTGAGATVRDSRNAGYGCAEIALRDALVELTA